MENTVKKERIHLLDILRGAAIIIMIAVHILFDITFLFPVPGAKNLYWGFVYYGYFASVPFIMISGICAQLTRSNAARGAKLLVTAFFFTAVTLLVTPEVPIYFGVLHMLAISMLVYSALEKYMLKIPAAVGFLLCLFLFILTFNITNGYLGLKGLLAVPLPGSLYGDDLLYYLGFHTPAFKSSDYWPIFPWIFLFFTGSFIGRYARNDQFPAWTRKNFCPPLAFLGRHSLLIYILHQPVIYGVLWLIFLFI